MSELQISLLVIGLLAVAGVFLYGQWQQWRYQRSLGTPPAEAQREMSHSPLQQDGHADLMDAADLTPAKDPDDEAVCGLLNEATDYVVTFLLKSPGSVDVLEKLWLRRFDFGKTVNACGLNASSDRWERLIPESPQLYRAFRIGLQLVDRAGPVGEIRLASFRDLLEDIALRLQVEVQLPVVAEVLRRAQELDRFCADVDQMIGINLLASGDRKLFGSEVAAAAERLGMALQADGAFHLLDAQGATLFKLVASDGTAFQHHLLNQMRVDSLTLLLDIPRVSEPARRFGEMVALAQEFEKAMRVTMADDQRVALNERSIEQIRASVAATEKLMHTGHVTPGSAQALRLFS